MIVDDTQFDTDLQGIVDELRDQLTANGIKLLKSVRDTPGNIMVSCPYHKDGQENRPSAGIKKSDGTFHCFTCGEVHTLPELISHCFGKDDIGSFGWTWLVKNFLSVSVEDRQTIPLNFDRDAHCMVTEYVSEEELDTYRVYHPYMWKRKMTPEVVDVFDIGFDAKTNCITFPIREESGKTLFVARRSVVTKFFNYPAGVIKPVYGLYELKELSKSEICSPSTGEMHSLGYPPEIIVCESMIDAITCWVYGKPAVALNGLGNNLQFKQLNNLPCRKLILATDNDDAGKKARERIRRYIRSKLITEYVFPAGRKDINDLTKEEFENLYEEF